MKVARRKSAALMAVVLALATSCAHFQPATESQRQAVLQVLQKRGVSATSLDRATVTVRHNAAVVYYWHVHEQSKTGGWTVRAELTDQNGQWVVVSEGPYDTVGRKIGRYMDSRCVAP